RALQADQALYTIQDLGQTADGLTPTVTGVNAKGQLSEWFNTADFSAPHPVGFTDGFGWEYLPGLDTTSSVAYGINANGDLVGYRVNEAGLYRAVRSRDGNGGEESVVLRGWRRASRSTAGSSPSATRSTMPAPWSARRCCRRETPSGSAR